MRAEERKSVHNSISRLAFVTLSVILQVAWILTLIIKVNNYYAEISLITSIMAFVVVLRLYARDGNMAIKMPWIMLILLFPIAGLSFYLLCGRLWGMRTIRMRFDQLELELKSMALQDCDPLEKLKENDRGIYNQSYYLRKYGDAPLYENTEVAYFPEAKDAYGDQLTRLQEAREFIFLEYFAIEDGEGFSEMKALLAAKAQQGVEVRIIYDDIGSVGFINSRFIKEMEQLGIQCRVFNPVRPFLNMFMNFRDHRKIMVIDGKIAYTGGYNIAGEYFNLTQPFGYWKDVGIRLEGEAVRYFTKMFLVMWNVIEHTDLSYERFFKRHPVDKYQGGYVQPFGDNPVNGERIGENVYMNLLKTAKRYIYFVTPYLIITEEMRRELGMAAKRGVDVRVVTPGIPDKKLVYRITRSYYGGLAREGVRIYEYTPGFCHAKACICDDEQAVVGTINMDYRSFYEQFEDGVYLYRDPSIQQMLLDYEDMLSVSTEVTEIYVQRKGFPTIGQCILRIIAPLI